MTCKICTLARPWLPVFFALWLTPASSDEPLKYAALKQPHPSEGGQPVEVIQVFWYGCPDCGNLDSHIERLMDELPDEVEFRRMPAVAPRWEPHARAFYAAESLGELDCFHEALGNAMQVERRRLFSEDDLVAFAEEAGLDAMAFRKAYRSPEVDSRVERARELTRRFGIDAVPSLIINGKYRTSLHLAGDHQTMSDTAEQLIREELGARVDSGTNQQRR
jgi:thiol:disulfide interchange protein DsbA